MEEKGKIYVGIDLGTTCSSLCTIDENTKELVFIPTEFDQYRFHSFFNTP